MITLEKETKIKLLKAIKTGVFDSEIFPELYKYEPAKILTKEQAKELWNDLDNDNFPKAERQS